MTTNYLTPGKIKLSDGSEMNYEPGKVTPSGNILDVLYAITRNNDKTRAMAAAAHTMGRGR
jgi:hypothetical protein